MCAKFSVQKNMFDLNLKSYNNWYELEIPTWNVDCVIFLFCVNMKLSIDFDYVKLNYFHSILFGYNLYGQFCFNSRLNIGIVRMAMATQEDVLKETLPNDLIKLEPQPNAEPISLTKITDLNTNCLKHIFMKLNLNDLLSAVDSSKHFKESVEWVYKHEYDKMRVSISAIRRSLTLVEVNFGFIILSDLSKILRLLRCFGHLIAELKIVYDRKSWPMIDQYVNEYCVNSLKEIELCKATKDAMENITKPFLEVKVVKLMDGVMGKNLTDFNKWFPQMQHLEFWCPDLIINRNNIEKYFSNLEHMTIGGLFKYNKDISFNYSNITEFVRLNPQLRSLKVRGDMMNAVFIQRISKHLQRLESLDIHCEHFFNLDRGLIHFKGLKEFTLDLGHGTTDPIVNIPLSFDQLNTFKIGARQFQVNGGFLDFINRHRLSLTKVTLLHYWTADSLKKTNKLELAKTMKLLTDIDLDNGILSVAELIDFLRICRAIEKLRFKLDPRSKIEELLKCISNKWRLSNVSRHITLEAVC